MRVFSNIIDFISRNPLATILFLLVIMAAPWLIGAFALVILAFILIGAISLITMMWRMKKIRSTFTSETFQEDKRSRKGNVTIHGSAHDDKRVKDTVGEYVDFKEIREEKR